MRSRVRGGGLAERRERASRVTAALAAAYPVAECALRHETPFQLLAATILSAQCTDERVNLVTPALFARFPTAAALARAPLAEVEKLVQSTGFFRAKAKNLVGMATRVVEEFGGELPRTVAELVTLPGVGRKTANVLLGTAYGIPSGVVVDTHVGRISRLLGLTRQLDAVKVEEELGGLLPRDEWIAFSHRVILHGRALCIAGRPRCGGCPLLACCARVGLPPLDAHGEPVRKPKSARAMKEAAMKQAAARRAARKRQAARQAQATSPPAPETPASPADTTQPKTVRTRRGAVPQTAVEPPRTTRPQAQGPGPTGLRAEGGRANRAATGGAPAASGRRSKSPPPPAPPAPAREGRTTSQARRPKGAG